MYQVTVKNEGIETLINAVSTSIEAPRLLSGSIKQGINVIDNFTFNITPNNPGYSQLKELVTLIEVFNIKTNLMEFQGRVLLPIGNMDSSGALSKVVTCESELGYLMDSTTRYGEYHNISVRDFLTVIIDNHNYGIEDYKKFVVGIVNVPDNNDSLYRFLDSGKTLDVIKDKLISRLGGELRIRNADGIKYLDYVISIGEVKITDIRLSKNLVTIEQEKDPTTIITRLIPLGAKGTDTEQRLNITSVNNGLDYIDDIEAMEEFGVITNVATFDDVTTASALLTKGRASQNETNRIKVKYKIGALDLATIDLDIDNFNVGNYYPVINPLMAIDESLRVVERTIDINSPQNSNLTVGDKFEDIKAYQLGIIKANRNIALVSANLTSAIDTVANVNTELNNAVEVIAQTNIVLSTTNETIVSITETIAIINEQLQTNISDTQNLALETNNISDNLVTTNAKLEKLKRRTIMGV